MSKEKIMSNEKVDQKFWNRADKIIHLANEQCHNSTNSKVSSSTLYAAARFNAFIVASMAEDVNEIIKDKEEAIKYFTDQYEKMFIENIDDYIENYEEYINKVKNS